MAYRIPLVFTLIMFTGTVLESLFPEHWDTWQKAVNLIIWRKGCPFGLVCLY
jgi:hypothetical protein